MMWIWIPVLAVLAAWWLAVAAAGRLRLPEPDMVSVNRMVKSAAEVWEPGSSLILESAPYPYAAISASGKLITRSDDSMPDNVTDAVRAHMAVLDVEKNGETVGKLLIDTGYGGVFADALTRLRWIALGLFLSVFAAGLLCWTYLNTAVLKPFWRLKGFAKHVAAGNLDLPLPMDRHHRFGAFTESFDLMREQIREARRREEQESKSKRELVASLSHDIKTPVTSIKLVSELLLAMEGEGERKNKIRTIYQKSEQIDHLVTNLLQASLEDLGELSVSVAEEESSVLEEWIRDADCYGAVRWDPVPGCLIRTDRQRLCQVLDNVIYNSYKYAGAPISIQFQLDRRELVVICKDRGKGVPDEELPLLFQKYYRGSNSHAAKMEGSGLGLYIARHLMEKMGGGIRCYNWEHGFCTELVIPLALPEEV